MSLASFIKRGLETEFAFGFKVSDFDGSQKILAAIEADDDILFDVFITVKNDIRLKIKVEPQLYGGYFMRLIYNSSKFNREKFVEYWSELIRKGTTTVLKLNDIPISKQDFIDFNELPQRFSFEFSFFPYCDEDENEQSRQETILNYTTIIFKMLLTMVSYNIMGREEGTSYYQISKRYERNPANRHLCLKLKGYQCCICGFDFESTYGQLGRNYIEVHHSLPVSEMEPGHIVNPKNELFPVCANCHRMLHRKSPPYTVEELRYILNSLNQN